MLTRGLSKFLNQITCVSYGFPCSFAGNTPAGTIFTFQLMSSADSLEGSQGNFVYSIKEMANLPLNSAIKKTAYIYFDFNPAIIANTTSNINGYAGFNNSTLSSFEVFPNPTSGILHIRGIAEGHLYVSSVEGNLVLDQNVAEGDEINLSHVKAGMYILFIHTAKGDFIQKVNINK